MRFERRLCLGCKKPIEDRRRQARYHASCHYRAKMARLQTPAAKRKRELYRLGLEEEVKDAPVVLQSDVSAPPLVVAPARPRRLHDLRDDVPGGQRFSVSW